jgi:hypothetical protein
MTKTTKTIFTDIDGTLLEQEQFEKINPVDFKVLPGVLEKINEWYDAGHYIVLTTARPHDMQLVTAQQMQRAGIKYHLLIMGLGRAERILINNNTTREPENDRALAVSVKRDEGFLNTDWSVVGL